MPSVIEVDPFPSLISHLEAVPTWQAGDAFWQKEERRAVMRLRDGRKPVYYGLILCVGVLDCRDSASCDYNGYCVLRRHWG